jgi:hypothetical protein
MHVKADAASIIDFDLLNFDIKQQCKELLPLPKID